LGLAVEVEDSTRQSQYGGPVWFSFVPKVAQEIEHGRRAERGDQAKGEATDGADLLLKLAGVAGLDRKMAGVVHPRGELIDENFPIGQFKHLHPE
jgi:hypothetical protein